MQESRFAEQSRAIQEALFFREREDFSIFFCLKLQNQVGVHHSLFFFVLLFFRIHIILITVILNSQDGTYSSYIC